jgi:methylisocitrate lyase
VAGIEIEDQLMPKRAHHHIGIEHLVPTDLMVAKIATAVASRRDHDFLVIGRTNACRTDGLDEALRRAEAYRRAGADMLLLLPRTPEEARAIGERIEGPLFYMMLGGIASIGMTLPELGRLGYRLVVDAQTPFFAQARALRLAYAALARGEVDPTLGDGMRAESAYVHAAIGLEEMLAIERRTVENTGGKHT